MMMTSSLWSQDTSQNEFSSRIDPYAIFIEHQMAGVLGCKYILKIGLNLNTNKHDSKKRGTEI